MNRHDLATTPIFMAALLPLLGCSSSGGDKEEARPHTTSGPLYVLHTRVSTGDEQVSYLATTTSIDAGSTFDLKNAIELPSGDVSLLRLEGTPYLYTGSCDDPTVTRWEVGKDGSIVQESTLSFQGAGQTDACFDSEFGIYSAERAFYVPFQSSSPVIVVWNPTTMQVVTTIPLPVQQEGDLLPLTNLSARGDRLFATVSWQGAFDADSSKFGDHVHVIEIDTATNKIVNESDEPRCNELTLSSKTSDGTLYYSTYSGDANIRWALGSSHGVDPCALRIVPPDSSFDQGFDVDLQSLAGGRPAGGLEMLNDDTAFIRVWHSELVDPLAPDLSNWEDVTGENGFLWWKWSLGSTQAERIPDQSPGNYTLTIAVDGRRFESHWSDDFSSTTLEELDPEGVIRPALSGKGQIFEIIRVR
ncbi:MAG TPA: hypothetical protein VHC69_06315 [Polyangiaceae bacterium]|nr:hypothetical protein [Polyangiaceae bacterium]